MNAAGRTVAWVEENPPGEDGIDYGAVLIHFTDGSALSVCGSSHEDVSQYVEMLDAGAVRRHQHVAQGYREQQRLHRLRRLEWLAVPCEERVRRRAEDRARMGRFEREMLDMLRADYMRLGFGYPQRSITCEQCGERGCPNTVSLAA